jgi:tRNA dimethylallyltransferase
VLAPPRPWLHERIARRFRMMVEAGAVDEARRLLARKLDTDLPAMKAIGVRDLGPLPASLDGLDQAVEKATAETRRYAKRQETFFRGQLGDWPRLDPADTAAWQRLLRGHS